MPPRPERSRLLHRVSALQPALCVTEQEQRRHTASLRAAAPAASLSPQAEDAATAAGGD